MKNTPVKDSIWRTITTTDNEAETPILWPPHAKSWLTGKDPDAGRDWGQGEKGMTEDEMAGWHHRLDRHGFGWTPGVGDGQGGLACCNSRGRKESDMTERQNWTELNWTTTENVLNTHYYFIIDFERKEINRSKIPMNLKAYHGESLYVTKENRK